MNEYLTLEDFFFFWRKFFFEKYKKYFKEWSDNVQCCLTFYYFLTGHDVL